MVAQRLQRQDVLERENPPRILLVSDEAAIRRPIGGRRVFAEQLARLEQMALRPNVIFQVVPAATAAYAGLVAPFTIMSFAQGPDVAYVEGPHAGEFIESSDTVAELLMTYDLIRSAAWSAAQSLEMIKELRESL